MKYLVDNIDFVVVSNSIKKISSGSLEEIIQAFLWSKVSSDLFVLNSERFSHPSFFEPTLQTSKHKKILKVNTSIVRILILSAFYSEQRLWEVQ